MSLGQLVLAGARGTYRHGSSLLFLIAMPLLTCVVLGLAYQDSNPGPSRVGVISGEGSAEMVQQLQSVAHVQAQTVERPHLTRLLQDGRIVVALDPQPDSTTLSYLADNHETRFVRAQLRASLPRQTWIETKVQATARRYIDDLVPGLTAFTLVTHALLLGSSLVWMRMGKVLKQLITTPAHPLTILTGFLLSNVLVGLLVAIVLNGGAWIIFRIRFEGSPGTWLLLICMGLTSFSALGILMASRTRYPAVYGGIQGLIVLFMMVAGGVFFPVERFPEAVRSWLALTPVAAFTEALRDVMVQGADLSLVLPQMMVLGGQALVAGVLGLWLFRWD